MKFAMLYGTNLAQALRTAITLKGVTQQQVADHFGVRQASVAGWLSTGRIAKRHLERLVSFFGDVVEPSHWGLPGPNGGLQPEAEMSTAERRTLKWGRDQSKIASLDSRRASVTINQLQRLLQVHTATRRRVIGDLLGRLADDPQNDEVAQELAFLLDNGLA